MIHLLSCFTLSSSLKTELNSPRRPFKLYTNIMNRDMAQYILLADFPALQSTSFEFEATFCHVKGNEKFMFNVRESSSEVTKVILDLGGNLITVDRSKSSLAKLGADTPDSGFFELLPGEDQ
jgi:hypothetical protein